MHRPGTPPRDGGTHSDPHLQRPTVNSDNRLPARDDRLRRLDSLSYLLDNSIRVPGTQARVGLDAVIGLIPGFGDIAGSAMSAYIVVQAARMGASVPTLVRMLLNVGTEAVVGTIPFAGDLFDAAWKSNARNVTLLRREMEVPGSTRRGSAAVVIGVTVALLAIFGVFGFIAFLIARALWRFLF
jgi:hypothetical protein